MGTRQVIAVVVVVLFVVFVVQNLDRTWIRFLGLKREIPTIALLLVTFAIGLVVGSVLATFGRGRQGRQEKTTRETNTGRT